MKNLPAVVFALVYIVLNYHTYKQLIYPMLMRNYYKGDITTFDIFKRDMIYFACMLWGWFLVFSLWLVYLATFLLVAMAGGDDAVSMVCLNMAGTFLFLSMVATGWPKPIGKFLLREK